MKILPNGKIQIEQGDTLYDIYGSNWRQQSGYTGDPTKLQIGTILPAPSAGSIGTQPYFNTPTITPEIDRNNAEIAKLRQQIEKTTTQTIPERIKELERTAFQPPVKTIQDLWDEAYKKSKLPDLETKISKIKDDLYSAEGKINENPWYSEAGRVGQIRKLYDIAQKDISNLTEQYNAELEKVKSQVDLAQKQQEAITTAQQKELEYLIKKETPESQWLQNSPETYKEWVLAGGKEGTGLKYADYVKEKTKIKANYSTSYDKQILDEAERQWIAAMIKDNALGKDNFISPEDYDFYKRQWLENQLPVSEYDKRFKKLQNPMNIYYSTMSPEDKRNALNNLIEVGYSEEEARRMLNLPQ